MTHVQILAVTLFLGLTFIANNGNAQIDALFSGSAVKIGTSTATCDASAGGAIRYNATDKTIEYCNETEWTAFGSGGGSSNPPSASTCNPGTYNATTGKCVFAYTGSVESWFVPTGVTSINVKAWGAGGGGVTYHNESPGGTGGYTKGTFSVTPGTQYSIAVGGGGGRGYVSSYSSGGTGAGGFGGGGSAPQNYSSGQSGTGGGGGASYIYHDTTPYIIAGGGGGASSLTGGSQPNYAGGSGGGTAGEAGAGGAGAGAGGTQSTAGLNASAHSTSGGQFVIGQGGAPSGYSTALNVGGAGGGGYYGGGAGISTTANSGGNGAPMPGGGGGSGYVIGTATNTTLTAGPTGPSLQSQSGNQLPPNSTDADYVSGVGISNAAENGGNGLVVIDW